MAEANWYVVHTYSGYENKVKANIEKTIENRGLQDQILEVSVPLQDVVEIKNGVRKKVQKKMFPGYVLLNMVMNDNTWYVVRNTRGVTGFVGPNANRPLPLTEEDLATMGLATDWVPSVDYEIGDTVRVISGPFIDSVCKVEDIDMEKQQVTVRISMFGRETPVSVDFTQVIRV